jgi:NADH dehydrogenase
MQHRVVVVGGGFGGLQVVRHLRRAPASITLVDRHNYSLFQPLAYQVATGGLSPAEIASPLRAIVKRQANARVVLAEVNQVDLEGRRIFLDGLPNGAERRELPYDTLVVATGAQYSYFGHPEWQAHAPELKSLDGALEIRTRILTAFEAAEVEQDGEQRESWLTFVVVGGGPTGVEMAGQIAELAHETLRRDFRAADPRTARVLLVEAGERLLPSFPESLSRKAARDLVQLGVTPLVGHTVDGIAADAVAIRSPAGDVERTAARTVIWAAGVEGSRLAATLAREAGVELDRAARLPVGPDLTLAGHPEVIALGDPVDGRSAEGTTAGLPGLAPVAIQQGRYAGRLIARRLRGRSTPLFHYRDKGNLATVGRSRAVADIKGMRLAGFPAWVVWLTIHLFYLIGFQNRFLVLLRWSITYLTRGRGARLIRARDAHEPPAERPGLVAGQARPSDDDIAAGGSQPPPTSLETRRN